VIEILDRPILLSLRGAYAVITLNRPAQLNCLTQTTMNELAQALESVRNDEQLCALIVTGAGGVFSAGADLSEVAALDVTTAYDFSRRGQRLLSALSEVAPISIAAIDGYCLGGGLDIALSCDLRYATPRSSFQHPGARRGIITGWGGTQLLPRLIGADATRRLLVTGDRIDAEEARRIGLINNIAEDALGFACRFAERIATTFTRAALLSINARLEC
jgi:enoyl-CoA hydratase/carnithine racemase